MHIIAAYESAVTLFSDDGEVRVFKSKKEALKQLGFRWISVNVREHFYQYSHTEQYLHDWVWVPHRVYTTARFIMRGDGGDVITAKDFDEIRIRKSRRRDPYKFWNGQGPVPGIRSGGRWGRYFRKLSSLNALRQAETFEEEGEVAPRPARQQNNLPDTWDDYPRSDYGVQSWKTYRAQQWR